MRLPSKKAKVSQMLGLSSNSALKRGSTIHTSKGRQSPDTSIHQDHHLIFYLYVILKIAQAGGMVHRVHLQLSDIQSSWSAATPAQDLVDDMITKLNHMVLTACTCLMTDGEDEAKVHDLIDETFIVRLSVIPQSKARFDQCKITKTSSHSSEAGSHKTSHMRDHFEEIGRLARMLKVGDNSEVKDTGRWDHAEGDKVRKIWSHRQSQTFTDLRHTMFKFVTGKHELTRTARLKVYHPVLYLPSPRQIENHLGLGIRTTPGAHPNFVRRDR